MTIDEASLRTALQKATTREELDKLRKLSKEIPALHALYLREVPAKHWAKSINVYDDLTNSFAIIRGLPCKNPHSSDLELGADAELLTDGELATLFPALIDNKDRSVKFRTDAIARRVVAMVKSELHLVKLWNKASLSAWRMARTASDEQLLQLHAWATNTQRAWRMGTKEYVTTNVGVTWFELLRRDLVTDVLFEDYAALVAIYKDRDRVREWISVPLGGDESWSELTLLQEVEALRDVHVHAARFAAKLRAFVLPHQVWPNDVKCEELIMLLAIAWGPELAPLVTKIYAGAKAEVKASHEQSEASRDLAYPLTGSPNADAMLAVIEEAIEGKVLKDVLAQARALLANRRALLPASAGGAVEELQWGLTPTDDAEKIVARFAKPWVAIEDGLRSSNPVAVLNAWSVAAALYNAERDVGGTKKVKVLPAKVYLHALASLEKHYGPEQPDGAALKKLLGYTARAATMFDRGFMAAYYQHDSVWERAAALYRTTKNVRYKEWIEPYLERMDESLIEDVPAKLARLVKETAPAKADSVERHIVVRTAKAPSAKTINRLFGPPIGVDGKRWPKHGKTKLEHVITIETRLLSDAARSAYGKNVMAVAVFVDSLHAGVNHAAVVPLTSTQIAKGAKGGRGEGSVETGYALQVLTASIPKRVFQGGKKTGALFELRKLFDRVDVLLPDRGSPSWIQEPDGDGTFLFDLDSSFAGELNLGDNGRLFVFDAMAFMQCH